MGIVHRKVNEEINQSLELIKELEHVVKEIQKNEVCLVLIFKICL